MGYRAPMTAPTPNTDPSAKVRLDKWLWAARCYKTRSAASTACQGGLVKVNGAAAKASQKVRIGDRVEARCAGDRRRILEVAALAEKRGPAEVAAQLFVDHSPPPPPRKERLLEPVVQVERGGGRPTKRDRRRMNRNRGGRW